MIPVIVRQEDRSGPNAAVILFQILAKPADSGAGIKYEDIVVVLDADARRVAADNKRVRAGNWQ